MSVTVLALPGNESLASALAALTQATLGELEVRRFPDGESYVRVLSPVAGKDFVLAATLHQPDAQMLPLYFLASTLRELGAARIVLVAPYLAYMRQDAIFHPGEGVTARYFARWVSTFVDGLITVDPHLHRIPQLEAVYAIPCETLAAAPLMASWLKQELPDAVLIGPDVESEQWVSEVASLAGCPFTVLQKTRRGDRDVSVSVPHIDAFRGRTPVLIDDIVSTGRTMAAACRLLTEQGFARPLGIGVHAILADDAMEALHQSGLARLITCNTIRHASNGIDLHPLLAAATTRLLNQLRQSAPPREEA